MRFPECQGVQANGETVEACREEMQGVLEDWMVRGLRLGRVGKPGSRECGK